MANLTKYTRQTTPYAKLNQVKRRADVKKLASFVERRGFELGLDSPLSHGSCRGMLYGMPM